jgi:alpha-ketoglutarate-dependent taurine dioxygenase
MEESVCQQRVLLFSMFVYLIFLFRFTKRIVGVTKDESDAILEHLFRHIFENHDLQVRFRWTKNDMAIWDNRCVFHTPTSDVFFFPI